MGQTVQVDIGKLNCEEQNRPGETHLLYTKTTISNPPVVFPKSS